MVMFALIFIPGIHSFTHGSTMGRFKGLVKFLRDLSSRMHSIGTTPTTNEEAYHSHRIPTPSSSVYELDPCIMSATGVYLPSHTRYTLSASNSIRESVSIADLCSQLGNQLPVQLVKLVAKDVLRALINIHRKGEPYRGSGINDFEDRSS